MIIYESGLLWLDQGVNQRTMPMMNNNLAILLTYLRLLCIPLMVICFYLPYAYGHMVAAAIFATASFTDWLDGFVARKMNMTTKFGAFLDPVADKMIVVVALVLVLSEHRGAWLAIPAAIIMSREVFISALREWMAELGKRTSVSVSILGKIKTAFQMMALIMLLLDLPGTGLDKLLWHLGSAFLYVAASLTLWSMLIYLKMAKSDLTMAAKKT